MLIQNKCLCIESISVIVSGGSKGTAKNQDIRIRHVFFRIKIIIKHGGREEIHWFETITFAFLLTSYSILSLCSNYYLSFFFTLLVLSFSYSISSFLYFFFFQFFILISCEFFYLNEQDEWEEIVLNVTMGNENE